MRSQLPPQGAGIAGGRIAHHELQELVGAALIALRLERAVALSPRGRGFLSGSFALAFGAARLCDRASKPGQDGHHEQRRGRDAAAMAPHEAADTVARSWPSARRSARCAR